MTPIKTDALKIAMCTVAVCGAALTGVAHAQVFKCVDSSGKTVYSQSPCPKDSRSTTLQRTAPPPVPAVAKGDGKGDGKSEAKSAGPKTAAEQELEFRKRRQDQEDAAKKAEARQADTKDKEDNCNRARASLVGFEAGGRQSRVEVSGERTFLSDSEVEQEKERARRLVQTLCN